MNLDDFEDDIEPAITLIRGEGYYLDGSVLSLEMPYPNHYSAKVAGSRIYQVTLVLDDDREIEEIACTCPYDWGEYCKHEVAVLYALRDQLASEELQAEQEETIQERETQKEKTQERETEGDTDTEYTRVERPQSVDIVSLLEEVGKEALLTFLSEYAKKDPALVSALVLAFPSSDESIQLTNLGIEFRDACAHGIETEFCGSDYEWEYEDEDEDEDEDGETLIWHFTLSLKKEIGAFLEMIRVAIMEGRIRYAGSLSAMMMHELSSFDCDTEDLGDDVQASVSQIVALWMDCIVSSEDASWLFGQFFCEAKKYDIKPQAILLRLCIHFAETQDDQEVLENYLVGLASEEAGENGENPLSWGWYNPVVKSSVELRHALLLKAERVEEAQALALENLGFDSMSKLAFDHAMDTHDYALAEKLALENTRPRYIGGTPDWGELLFSVYQASGDTEKMRSLAKTFLLGGNLAYYRILKDSYTTDTWETVVDGLLDELQEGGFNHDLVYRSNTYPEVLKAEKRLERLLSYLQKVPALVRRYQEVLLPDYQDEVFALYRQVILERGEKVANRGEYQELASWLKDLVFIGGTAVAKECVEALEPRYRKRPAMKDELRKAGVL
ncbi:MAG: SWIM zinc finger family protein [Sphaerochaeta sp.]